MSRSLSPRLREIRARVLRDGDPEFWVFGPLCSPVVCASWEEANEIARQRAYRKPGDVFRAEERRRDGRLVCVARLREWASWGVNAMEDYRHGA